MKHYKIILLLCIATSFAYTTAHKHYISLTNVDYLKKQESVQIISRIYIDDLESLLRQRYDENITLNPDKESSEETLNYIKKYLTEKISIKINNQDQTLSFIGKKYEDDMVVCYLEIEKVKSIQQFEITNKILFDIFSEQKNMVKTHINSIDKDFILSKQRNKGSITY